jgi:Ni/Fe-hydrogenase subunit HybB-like protein
VSRVPLYGTQPKFTWRMLATVLAGQSIVLFFGALVARGTAIAGEGDAGADRLLWGGSAIAVLALVAAGLMRGPVGITLGWLVQALTWLSALVVPAMLLVALIFTGLWVLCLVQGAKVDRLVAQREADAAGR